MKICAVSAQDLFQVGLVDQKFIDYPQDLFLKYGTNRLYVKRQEENKEFVNIDDIVQMAKMSFAKLWQQDCENIIILLGGKKELGQWRTQQGNEKWTKKMHQKKLKKNRKHHRRTLFEKSLLKNETKSLISASYNGCIRINYIKAKINKSGKQQRSIL